MRLPARRALHLLVPLGLLALGCTQGCTRKADEPWREIRLETRARFSGLWFTDSLNGWVAGGALGVRGGLLGRTRDGGRTWSIRSDVLPGTDEGYQFAGLQFSDTSSGFMVGQHGYVLRTSDGGVNWRRVRDGRSSSDHMVHVHMLDDRTGWAVGPATILGTRDGGETWGVLAQNRSENGYLSANAIAFVDVSRGWLVSHGGQLMRTENGGADWTRVPLAFPRDAHPTLWDITFADATHGWLVGEEGTILNTADGGTTWERQSTGVPVERILAKGEKPRPPDIIPGLDGGPARLTLTAVRFADRERGFALGWYSDVAESIILGTRDGGATWQTERVAPGQLLHALFVLDRTHAWAAGDRERMLPQTFYRYVAAE